MPTPPDCDAKPTRPATGRDGREGRVHANAGSVFTTPTQFGPDEAHAGAPALRGEGFLDAVAVVAARRTLPRSPPGRSTPFSAHCRGDVEHLCGRHGDHGEIDRAGDVEDRRTRRCDRDRPGVRIDRMHWAGEVALDQVRRRSHDRSNRWSTAGADDGDRAGGGAGGRSTGPGRRRRVRARGPRSASLGTSSKSTPPTPRHRRGPSARRSRRVRTRRPSGRFWRRYVARKRRMPRAAARCTSDSRNARAEPTCPAVVFDHERDLGDPSSSASVVLASATSRPSTSATSMQCERSSAGGRVSAASRRRRDRREEPEVPRLVGRALVQAADRSTSSATQRSDAGRAAVGQQDVALVERRRRHQVLLVVPGPDSHMVRDHRARRQGHWSGKREAGRSALVGAWVMQHTRSIHAL